MATVVIARMLCRHIKKSGNNQVVTFEQEHGGANNATKNTGVTNRPHIRTAISPPSRLSIHTDKSALVGMFAVGTCYSCTLATE